ncbi:MAG: adenylate/guanylate cyclase domain-containing protein, partial [Candidatus Desantisbacteria bacterium]
MDELKEALRKIGEFRGKRCVLVTDMKGSTSLFSERGDMAAVIVQQQRDLLMEEIEKMQGKAWPVGGDGILAFFSSSENGLKSAVNIQTRLKQEDFSIRAGLHTGDVFLDPNMQSQTINIASRIMGLADGGQILVSKNTYQETGKIDLARFHSHGEYNPKGITEPIGVYEVLWHKDQKPKRPVKKGIKAFPIKSTIVIGAILLLFLGLIAIKGIFQPQKTGSTRKVEISLIPPRVSVEFYPPINYYGGLPESSNLKVKKAFENGRK